MDDASYGKLIELLMGTQKIEAAANSLHKTMLDKDLDTGYQIHGFASIQSIAGSLDYEIKCDGRTILAHYTRFNKAEGDHINPFVRYQFLLNADALPGDAFKQPKLLLTIEFGRDGHFELGGKIWNDKSSDQYRAEMRNAVLIEVVSQLQNAIL